MSETNNIIKIQIPNCSSNYQISKDIYSFLNKQGNHITISLLQKKQSGGISFFGNIFGTTTTADPQTNNNNTTNTPTKSVDDTTATKSADDNNTTTTPPNNVDDDNNIQENIIELEFQNKTHNIEKIKGTKLYYLYLRNGECARWV
jgi:hypothetical protein